MHIVIIQSIIIQDELLLGSAWRGLESIKEGDCEEEVCALWSRQGAPNYPTAAGDESPYSPTVGPFSPFAGTLSPSSPTSRDHPPYSPTADAMHIDYVIILQDNLNKTDPYSFYAASCLPPSSPCTTVHPTTSLCSSDEQTSACPTDELTNASRTHDSFEPAATPTAALTYDAPEPAATPAAALGEAAQVTSGCYSVCYYSYAAIYRVYVVFKTSKCIA